jgi:hypothetical protein
MHHDRAPDWRTSPGSRILPKDGPGVLPCKNDHRHAARIVDDDTDGTLVFPGPLSAQGA